MSRLAHPLFLICIMVGTSFAGLPSRAMAAPAAMADTRPVPYWASIAVQRARMRKGPAETLPALWDYQRKNLPMKVLAVHETWRKVQDPDGSIGWMAARLLSKRTTAIVVGGIAAVREDAATDSDVLYRVEPGVVGTVKDCNAGWCLFDVDGRRGWIEAARIWGGHD